jgi:hypothetical protein
MSDEKKMTPEDVSEEELAIAVQLIRTARRELNNDVEGHSVDDADSAQHFTDLNVC